MDDATREIAKMAVESANALAQQLITLATAILALTITFTKDIIKDTHNSPLWLLKLSWVVFLASICFGIAAMAALTGTLAPVQGEASLTLGFNVRLHAGLQFLSFVSGIILIIIFGMKSLTKQTHHPSDVDIGKDW